MNARFGIVLGRFQPLHLGHMEYLEAAASRCERLFIGITNPDIQGSEFVEADQERSKPSNNPFSYVDRHLMIEASLLASGWKAQSFCIVAAPITSPSRLRSYLPPPSDSECFVTVYDEWGDQKAQELESLGYPVTILWRRSHSDRVTSGTWIREAIRRGDPWQHVVPSEVASYIEEAELTLELGRRSVD